MTATPSVLELSGAAQALYNAAITGLHDAFATRYLSAAGLVVLLYDHILTFPDEITLVWYSRRSFAKYAFLVNRYLVLASLLVIAYEMCGFIGIELCRNILTTASILGILSVGIANTLVLLRVVTLWDHRPIVTKLMTFGFLASFTTQLVTMAITTARLGPHVVWSPGANMCITTTTTSVYIVVWSAPMLFEICVLVSTIMNALDRPRVANLKMTQALYMDGVFYFFTLSCFRALNLAFSTVKRSSMVMLSAFFVWAMTTTVLNRSLLRIYQAEADSLEENPNARPGSSAGRRSSVSVGRKSGNSLQLKTFLDIDSPVSTESRFPSPRRMFSR
ncbi:hypothetical protein K474DRAFT_1599946 [Panus rudis PR-1116 ss-1]|nr:hypothetical protein K474DRAFT_1599946 [Panus rudis PR-1116 ss-1]